MIAAALSLSLFLLFLGVISPLTALGVKLDSFTRLVVGVVAAVIAVLAIVWWG